MLNQAFVATRLLLTIATAKAELELATAVAVDAKLALSTNISSLTLASHKSLQPVCKARIGSTRAGRRDTKGEVSR